MYLEYYGLTRKPFSKTPDPGMLYMSPGHAEALARMEQAVEDQELMVLTGDIGCGKSTLSRALIDRLPKSVMPALIINPRLTPNQLLRTVARRLGEDNPRYFRSDLIDQINELLFKYYEKGVSPLLVIDEAQSIPTRDTFEEIRLLTNFQLDDANLFSIILMGQPELNRRLSHQAYESLVQRVGFKYHLEALKPGEVKEYVRFRLERSGGDEGVFSGEALDLIARMSGGVPRWINNIGSAAMIEGFGREAEIIDEHIIWDVVCDLGLADSNRLKDDQEKGRPKKGGAGRKNKTRKRGAAALEAAASK
jgi:type II secretory pathway predicted ATPase ExeA